MTKNVNRSPIIRAFLGDAIVVDSFAGGGGASTGIEQALGRSPDIAINHDPEAIEMHRRNHPTTTHYIEDVWKVDPAEACGGKPVALAWFSPTCTYFSKAKGNPLGPDAVKIRGQAWIVLEWLREVRPAIGLCENVEEFTRWGPLHETDSKGCKRSREHSKPGCERVDGACTKKGCTYGQCAMPSSSKSKRCQFNTPIKERAGETYREWKAAIEALGYTFDERVMRACDFGAPTTRRRWFAQFRCDGKPASWPEPTHGPGRAAPYRTAAEIIDWSVPCPSIFERDRDLAEKTLARIARGIQKFVLDAAKPFVIPVNHAGYDKHGDKRRDHRVHDLADPLPTVTGARRGGHAIAVPYLVHRSNGERPEVVDEDGTVHAAQAPRIYDVQEPIGTMVAGGIKHAACVAMLIKNNGGNNDAAGSSGQDLRKPVDTISCRDAKSITVGHLMKYYGTSTASGLGEPAPTVVAGSKAGGKLAQVSSFLVRYNGESVGQTHDEPLGTIDTTDRYGLVTVTIDGEQYVLADIGMRMLTPRELFRAQGFEDSYEIEPEYEGKPMTKTAQIRMAGNSVCPPIAAALVRAALGIADLKDAPPAQVAAPAPLVLTSPVKCSRPRRAVRKPAPRAVVRAPAVREAEAEAEVLALLAQGDEKRAIEAMVKKLGLSRAEALAMVEAS